MAWRLLQRHRLLGIRSRETGPAASGRVVHAAALRVPLVRTLADDHPSRLPEHQPVASNRCKVPRSPHPSAIVGHGHIIQRVLARSGHDPPALSACLESPAGNTAACNLHYVRVAVLCRDLGARCG